MLVVLGSLPCQIPSRQVEQSPPGNHRLGRAFDSGNHGSVYSGLEGLWRGCVSDAKEDEVFMWADDAHQSRDDGGNPKRSVSRSSRPVTAAVICSAAMRDQVIPFPP